MSALYLNATYMYTTHYPPHCSGGTVVPVGHAFHSSAASLAEEIHVERLNIPQRHVDMGDVNFVRRTGPVVFDACSHKGHQVGTSPALPSWFQFVSCFVKLVVLDVG